MRGWFSELQKDGETQVTPLKIDMKHNHEGLEVHFPFYMGDLYVPCESSRVHLSMLSRTSCDMMSRKTLRNDTRHPQNNTNQ